MSKTLLNLNKMDDRVLDALRNRGHSDEQIQKMSPEDVFDEFCQWEGLLGWGPTLREALDDLRANKAQVEQAAEEREGRYQYLRDEVAKG
jgi:hypothetical protein